ncbi:hypothetical protein M2164_003401 [Streptomyces sp. SAI-208]|uniref:DUF4328 domain-containing protein n=1 Tax=unclassified Streptomyces TaxID=2593676 RepID=UPI002475DAFB|nr:MULTISPECIES: DUF4328 domain-containing protein [unclassified Streptomyces]MDH6516945.1 hypothetical protein [Streptomyces sp. SAI-090]MDH6549160.1 hypothetical protein [Streptomyces sp. SAI-041]MDH6586824.1 hypothetical protein [Streptomyces sp. SAI-133]MDH6607766.1 hypothetical protein [Streptomyces sp. SAI-208]MDH6618966.1 hypothetical protein [Streptomyces sp. SAI-135]
MLCTRCHHFEAAPDGVLCSQCAAAPAFQAPPAGAPKAWLRSPVGLGRATAVLLAVTAAVDAFAVGADFLEYDVTGDLAGGAFGDAVLDRADLADTLTAVAASAQAAVLLACAVVFVIWLWRVRVNAEVFAPDGHRKARGWVIAGWVVPFVSVWYPRRVVLDVWDASSPEGQREGHALVNVWWTLWLLTNVVGRFLAGMAGEADSPQEIHDAMAQMMFADGVDLVAALVAAALVLRLTRMQDEKARRGPAVPAAV